MISNLYFLTFSVTSVQEKINWCGEKNIASLKPRLSISALDWCLHLCWRARCSERCSASSAYCMMWCSAYCCMVWCSAYWMVWYGGAWCSVWCSVWYCVVQHSTQCMVQFNVWHFAECNHSASLWHLIITTFNHIYHDWNERFKNVNSICVWLWEGVVEWNI